MWLLRTKQKLREAEWLILVLGYLLRGLLSTFREDKATGGVPSSAPISAPLVII